jgi:hypothetical protein
LSSGSLTNARVLSKPGSGTVMSYCPSPENSREGHDILSVRLVLPGTWRGQLLMFHTTYYSVGLERAGLGGSTMEHACKCCECLQHFEGRIRESWRRRVSPYPSNPHGETQAGEGQRQLVTSVCARGATETDSLQQVEV